MPLTLALIIGANLLSTVVALSLAALLSFRYLSRLVDPLVCVSAGLLLAVALTHLVPEALEGGIDPHAFGWLLLAALLGFFLLEKVALIHHTHHHEGDAHHHEHGHDALEARGGLPVLVGDAFHRFADGVVIAAAFLLDWQAGLLATLAVMAHEVPHSVGDFMILLNAGFSQRRAYWYQMLAGSSAALGGLAGYLLLDASAALLPYVLTVAAASFIYIALSDLLPEMMRRSSLRKSVPEVLLVLGGALLAAVLLAAIDAGAH